MMSGLRKSTGLRLMIGATESNSIMPIAVFRPVSAGPDSQVQRSLHERGCRGHRSHPPGLPDNFPDIMPRLASGAAAMLRTEMEKDVEMAKHLPEGCFRGSGFAGVAKWFSKRSWYKIRSGSSSQ
jgi:hypothetical protein